MRSKFALLVLPAWLVACSVDASDLALTAHIAEPSIQVTDSAFSGINGGFKLDLVLGSEANGSTQVTSADFELQNEAGESLAQLSDAVPDPMFPISLNKGESKRVVFTIEDIGVDRSAVCAGRVRIVGSVTDTLKNGMQPVQSDLFTPDCS
ncbi:MAG TPA: hypothetical protein VER11_00575 [Polyangiaceae bacterium]|nr:hypothetical protein [Polyangiaceae bacterium]